MRQNGIIKMKLRAIFSHLRNLAQMLIVMALLASCLGADAGRAGRPLITDFTVTSTDTSTDEQCTDFINDEFTACLTECPDETHIASEQEILDIIESLKNTVGLTEQEELDLTDLATESKGVCVKDIVRPTNAIKIKNDYCACKNSTPLILNNCIGFCSGRSTSDEERLYVNVILDPTIELNEELGDLSSWCTKEIGDGLTNPSCVLELRDAGGTRTVPITIFTSSKSFTADLKGIPLNVTYVARIVENTSGAVSDEFQIRRFDYDPNVSEISKGPLHIMGISMYSCIQRQGIPGVQGIDFTLALRMHFFFAANKQPPTLPPTNDGSIFCHDIQQYADLNDSPLYERLELIPLHFTLWDESDPRLADTNGDSIPDVNDDLKQRLLDEYNINVTTLDIFKPLPWPNVVPITSGSGGSPTAPLMGFFMIPWIDANSGLGFCPTQDHYNGNDPTFRVMKEVVGVDTEGLYLAEREPLVISGTDGGLIPGPQDVILVREGMLEKIWFYYDDGKHFEPDPITAGQKTIMFYWPPDINNPYTRKSNQRIYIVRRSDEIGSAAGSSTIPTSIRPPDKRFGCIPSLGEPLDF